MGPVGCSNYSYHVISKLLVFQCLHWPLVMTGVIRENGEISMCVSVCSCICTLVKKKCPQREGEIVDIFQMWTFACPHFFQNPSNKKEKCVCVCV